MVMNRLNSYVTRYNRGAITCVSISLAPSPTFVFGPCRYDFKIFNFYIYLFVLCLDSNGFITKYRVHCLGHACVEQSQTSTRKG